ncbi:uncharacterized protein LOC114334891 isoform X2 [Diabrotica virgifera virgifera]|uniref:PXA domain-containing protein n=1 Tax=Diabrotica virgifera virgifera TaxID=50390 RepID=A0ABM5JLV8_DIAVI|nr:uncharacterized protein LOC114334891 isoform X2 [Diabrotica virgifera virgifera]
MSLIADVLLNWKIFIVGVGLLTSISIINSAFPLLPVSGVTFLSFSVLIWFGSLCITFFYLHKLLQRNEPLEIIKVSKHHKKEPVKVKPDPKKLDGLVGDIDKYFLSIWYVYISSDAEFTKESRVFLEDVIKRLVEVQSCVHNKVLTHSILNIFLRHLKEYRRGLKRKEKYSGNIEELYRYSHIISTNPKVKNYFVQQLTTNVMRHFINSELWNSLPCQVLVSIIARKLILFLVNFISNPEILNYKLLNLLASNFIREKYNLDKYSRICVSQYYTVVDSTRISEDKLPIEQKSSPTVTSNVQLNENVVMVENKSSEQETEVRKRKNGIVTQQKGKKKAEIPKKVDSAEEVKEEHARTEKPPASAPVKIHEPRLTRSTKTYADTRDLAFGISLGQDPLDALPLTMENMKIKMEHVEDSANLLLIEVKQTTQSTMEGLKSSIKPISDATVHTLHNIKDLQESTMNNALHKIGDFQDEAAGVVEGILDFGRAGLRKGLRLTGLHDNIEQAKASLSMSQSSKNLSKKKSSKTVRSESAERSAVEEESVWINPLQMESPNFDGQILLEKSIEPEKEKREMEIPSISMEEPSSGTTSPDPEYEDAADLASSIAKLRSLLQQRSSESSMSTPALSPMPPDELMQKPENDSALDPDEVDGMIPSFYKFCAKTATGVLDKTIHSIKTALPSHVPGVEHSDDAWIFLQTDQSEVDVLSRMKKLLSERKEYCTLDTEIDTAYEAIDSLDTFQHSLFSKSMEFEDELDEFEAKLPITKALVDIACELLSDTDSPLIREPVIKALFLTLGHSVEKYVINIMDLSMDYLCTNLMTIPEFTNNNVLYLEMDVFVESIVASFPDSLKLTFGKTALQKAVHLLVSSLQVQKINEDVILQIFELISLKLIEESSRPYPPASA